MNSSVWLMITKDEPERIEHRLENVGRSWPNHVPKTVEIVSSPKTPRPRVSPQGVPRGTGHWQVGRAPEVLLRFVAEDMTIIALCAQLPL